MAGAGSASVKASDPEVAVVLAGPIGTGKTCFCVRVHEGLFKATYKPTISPDYSSVRRAVPGGGGMATVQLWDTSGEERFRALAKHYYRAKHCVVLMYDASDPLTAEDLLRFVTGESGVVDGARLGIGAVVIGNKADLLDEPARAEAAAILETTRAAVSEALAGSSVEGFLASVKAEENVESALAAALRLGLAARRAWEEEEDGAPDAAGGYGTRGGGAGGGGLRINGGGGGGPGCPGQGGKCPIG